MCRRLRAPALQFQSRGCSRRQRGERGDEAAAGRASESVCMAAERTKAGSRWPPGGSGGGRMLRGAEGGKQLRGRQAKARPVRAVPPGPGQGYFTAGLAALFLCLTALLVFLPLVLPPLPPPPLLLLLVPVGLMAVLLALALVPSDGRGATAAVASSCVY